MKCSKKIAIKIKQYEKTLNKERKLYYAIEKYFVEELGAEGFVHPFIADSPKGRLQNDDEYCDQRCIGEDWYAGSYYHQIEGSKKYAGYTFDL